MKKAMKKRSTARRAHSEELPTMGRLEEGLNPEQLEVVRHDGGPCAVYRVSNGWTLTEEA